MIRIGNIKIDANVMLAPMSGVTDLPYRMINREFGCKFAFTEMISATGLHYNNRRTLEMLSVTEDDSPLGVQLIENDEQQLLTAMERIENIKFDILDFNAACPARKVVRRGKGSALMKDPEKFQRLIRLMVKNSSRPVTVKIRTGWDKDHLNALDIAKRAEDAGVSAVFLHGRTSRQFYRDDVDYETIYNVSKKLSIPVIASGDILSPQAAKTMLDRTGSSGILVARGSFGNPWIFRDIEDFLLSGTLHKRPKADMTAVVMKKHLQKLFDFYGRYRAPYIYRKTFVYYTRFFRGIKELRQNVFKITEKKGFERIIEEFSKNSLRHSENY
ncbi:MAG: tRNA dihydrouridine synthase DusB [Elusimicrobiota bacterium]